MLLAEQRGITEEQLIDDLNADHVNDFKQFDISHDNYYSTHSAENQHYSNLIYERIRDAGYVYTEEVEQLFDPEREMFLADRHVRGECPRCGAPDQPGDNCDNCGATYDARELVNPRSALSDATPVLRKSTHYFVDLPKWTEFLREYIHNGSQQPEIANKLEEWVEGGLRAWDISRDEPYFGFPIPDAPGKYFYVWMDAPIGYLASFKKWCDKNQVEFDDFWRVDSDCEVHHFVGKDIINFHSMFWPGTLQHSGFRTPTKVHAHGFLTVDGEKMSKSRGTFILAKTYLEHLEPDYLRYYLAARLSANSSDIDFRLDDFVSRVNSDLVGKLVNIASRCAGFLAKNFDNQLGDHLANQALWDEFTEAKEQLANWYEVGDTTRVVRRVMELADSCNRYLSENAPWDLIKQPDSRDQVQVVCTMAINLFRTLSAYLKPIVPRLVSRAEDYLNAGELTWENATEPLLRHTLNQFQPLLKRVDMKQVRKMIVSGAEDNSSSDSAKASNADVEELASTINIDDFAKVDLRVALIKEAETVEGADKLLRLKLDVGGNERTVLSGIRSAYATEDLVGKLTVVVANLAPRTMKFGTSEGMVLAAGEGGKEIFLLSPDSGAKSGMRVT